MIRSRPFAGALILLTAGTVLLAAAAPPRPPWPSTNGKR